MLARMTWTLRVSVLLALLSVGVGRFGAYAQTKPASAQDSGAWVQEFPLALVYHGFARFDAGDFQGAIDAWQGYLKLASADADTTSVQKLIHEALVQQYPMMLVYEGLALVQGGDTTAGIQSWERYLTLAPEDPDTASVRQLMEQIFFRQYPMALLYRGVFQFRNYDYEQAISSWERYLDVASSEQEKGDVRSLIAIARTELENRDIAIGH